MNNIEFCDKLIAVTKLKTLYCKGCFGTVLTAKGKEDVIAHDDYNKKHKKEIMAATKDTFAFDCSGLIKGIFWGFTGNKNMIYGGAVYNDGPIKDINAATIIAKCEDVSTDMDYIEPGEVLYMTNHCGVYIGDGNVVECTPKWLNGVQITKLKSRAWKKHGKLTQLNYVKGLHDPKNEKPHLALPILRKGSRGTYTNYLQADLNYVMKSGLAIDGKYGPLTEAAVKSFQKSRGITADGIYGPITYKYMKEALK